MTPGIAVTGGVAGTGNLGSALLLLAAAILVVPTGARARLTRLTGTRPGLWPRLVGSGQRLLARAEVSHRWPVTLAGCGFGLLCSLGYGPVAGVITAGYAGLGTRLVLRRRAVTAARRDLTNTLDGLACLVGDLRAGVPPAVALNAALPLLIAAVPRMATTATVSDLAGHLDGTARGQVLARLAAAWQIAETTGAPLADVLDRLDTEVRTGERARALAAAHAASTQVTATLLGALPVAGVVLGYGMGADPLALLFGTPAGAACAITAVLLQLAGLAWARRLAEIDPARINLAESPGRLA